MEIYTYKNYEAYIKAQLNVSNQKIKRSNVNKHIAVLNNLKLHLSGIINTKTSDILCVGARNCNEINAFRIVFAGNNINIKGIDLSNRKFKDCTVEEMDMNHLKFEDNSFDIIYAHHSLEHNITPQTAADEFLRVVRSGGIIYTITPLLYEPEVCDCTAFRRNDVPNLFKSMTQETLLLRIVKKGEDVAEENELRAAFRIKK